MSQYGLTYTSRRGRNVKLDAFSPAIIVKTIIVNMQNATVGDSPMHLVKTTHVSGFSGQDLKVLVISSSFHNQSNFYGITYTHTWIPETSSIRTDARYTIAPDSNPAFRDRIVFNYGLLRIL